MEHGDDFPGGPACNGICPECGGSSGDCYNDYCEHCLKLQPVWCKECHSMVDPDYMTLEGICVQCSEDRETEPVNLLILTKNENRTHHHAGHAC